MVIYIVCFDLSASEQDQRKQIFYWLEFLASSIAPPLPASSSSPAPKLSPKWSIILVGLRSDLATNPSSFSSSELISWQQQWPSLPLFPTLFAVSSFTSMDSVKELLLVVEKECNRIFEDHAIHIPSTFKSLLSVFQEFSEEKTIIHQDSLMQYDPCGMSRERYATTKSTKRNRNENQNEIKKRKHNKDTMKQTKPNQTKPNQTKPNQTKPNQTKPNQNTPES
jgi:hypothetical protein